MVGAAKLMSSRQVRRLPVMGGDGKLTGVVSLGDLAMKRDQSLVGEVLQEISK